MRTIKMKNVMLSLGLLLLTNTSKAELSQANFSGIRLSEEQRSLLKSVHMTVRDTVLNGSDTVAEYIQNQRPEPSPEIRAKRKKAVQAFFAKSDEEKLELLQEASKLAKAIVAAQSDDDKIAAFDKLVPVLKELPPPRRRPADLPQPCMEN